MTYKAVIIALAFCMIALGPSAPRVFAREQAPPAEQGPASTPEEDSGEISAVPNRPTLATTAESVQRGVLEVEYGFEGGRGHQNINGLVKFGLFKNLELRFLHNPYERDGGIAAMGDCGAGFKWKIFPQKGHRPTVSLLYSAFLPTAGNGLGIGATSHQALVLVSKDFGKQHFDVNEGINALGRVGAAGYDRSYFSALSWSTSFTKKWGATAEIAGFSRASADNPATLTLLAAPTYNLKSWMVLDAGAYYAVYGNYPRWTIFAGVTYAIADLYHKRLANRPAHR
ncbi:MAG: hypothetical protein LAN71_03585 [Acidobacteriia bacterium]|nr:hypothetical protein [Terriglobia bacterium]